ncbi:MAG: hypothetical protein V4516_16130, partial [Pseudomonadota bacterium]
MTDALERIAAALERFAPAPMPAPDYHAADAFVWHVDPDRLEPVANVSRVGIGLLVGVDRSRDTLLANTQILRDAGILESELRLAHFMAQCGAETGGFVVLRESLAYRP